MTLWYNGWYNGLANTGNYNPARARGGEHAVIVYCKANPDKTVIQAIAVAIKQYRAARGIKVKGEK